MKEPTIRNRIALGALASLALVVAGWALLGGRSQPQMGSNQEVFRTVDALFTAVTARNEKWLGDCEQRLRAQRDAGMLNAPAWKRLEGVIAQARAGKWEPAAHTLYDFIQGQRREGANEQASSPRNPQSPEKTTRTARVATTARVNRP